MSLVVDLTPLWTAVNANFPIFMSIFAPIAGISIAMILVLFIIGEVKKAFGSGGG